LGAAFPHKISGHRIATCGLFTLGSFISRLSTKSLGLNIQNQRMMDKATYSNRHHGVAEDLISLAERLVGCFDIAQVIDNQQSVQ
jgi:hypothetical protein